MKIPMFGRLKLKNDKFINEVKEAKEEFTLHVNLIKLGILIK